MMLQRASWLLRETASPLFVLAHRGGRGPWRENTLEAFGGALRLDADGVELDVRRAGDGNLVVHHDPAVEDLGPIATLTGPQLPSWLPTLLEALDVCAGALVNVEIKNSPFEPGYDPEEQVSVAVASLLVDQIRSGIVAGLDEPPLGTSVGSRPTRVVVSSFSGRSLEVARDAAAQAGGELALGLLVHPALDPTDGLRAAIALGCASLHPFHSLVTQGLVERAHEEGMALIAWTVNTPAELDALCEAGVDGVITDEVAETLRNLGRTSS